MKYLLRILLLLSIISFLNSCKSHDHHHGNHAEEHMHSKSIEELVKHFDSPEREAWQKPNEVIQLILKNGIAKNSSNFKIIDLGAGSGYFSFRFLDAGIKVIALDINDQFIEYLNTKAKTHPKKENLEIRKTDPSKPNIQTKEASALISVNVYHHLENRIDYLKSLKNALKDDGILYIIDFKDGDLKIGPPSKIKILTKTILEELVSAGYKVEIEEKLLPYQNIFVAKLR
jgi:SAM-dependent methyltransferase